MLSVGPAIDSKGGGRLIINSCANRSPVLNSDMSILSRCLLISVLSAGIVGCLRQTARADETKDVIIEVNAGPIDREQVTLEVELPGTFKNAGPLHLKRLDNGQMVPAQRLPGTTSRIAWVLEERLPAGEMRRYKVCQSAANAPDEEVTVHDDGRRLLVEVSGKPVLAYNHATVPSPDPNHPYYARSGYIHPVFTPSGYVLTDDFNPDHAHQHGIMFAWREGTFEGHATNPWHQAEGTGRVEHVELERQGGGPVFGHFTAKLRQVDLTSPDGPKPILDERWQVRIGNLPRQFVIDIELIQTCAGRSPYRVENIHYGGLAVRGSAAWGGQKPPTYTFLTDLGKTREDGDQSRARWVDFTGESDGKTAGIAALCHPASYRFPQPVRLHPWMPYFCYTPASLGAFEILPQRPYFSRYRFICHDGRLTSEELERLWQDYASPPQVRMLGDEGERTSGEISE